MQNKSKKISFKVSLRIFCVALGCNSWSPLCGDRELNQELIKICSLAVSPCTQGWDNQWKGTRVHPTGLWGNFRQKHLGTGRINYLYTTYSTFNIDYIKFLKFYSLTHLSFVSCFRYWFFVNTSGRTSLRTLVLYLSITITFYFTTFSFCCWLKTSVL